MQNALTTLNPQIQIKGASDITIHQHKISGNAQKRKKQALLFHGTILYNFDIDRIEQYLNFPPKQPEYRKSRSHTNFVTNLNEKATTIKQTISSQWNAKKPFKLETQSHQISSLVESKYALDKWNLKK